MNILVICQYYYPEPFRIHDLCEELVLRGHAVTVVTGEPNYPDGDIYQGYENHQRADEIQMGEGRKRQPPLQAGRIVAELVSRPRVGEFMHRQRAENDKHDREKMNDDGNGNNTYIIDRNVSHISII